MVEVLKSTFEEYLPSIEEAIREADFIAMDSEFSGLTYDDKSLNSLFDTSEERYKKLAKGMRQFTMTQIGISTFTKDKFENNYVAKTFNCYLCPPSFGPVDVRFLVQSSSLGFMCKHDFNFNKFMYEGISHLNEEQEKQVKDHLQSKVMFKGGQDRSMDIDEQVMQGVCSEISEWLVKTRKAEDTLEIPRIKALRFMKDYILQTEIRNRFPNVWIDFDKARNLLVSELSEEEINTRKENIKTTREDREDVLFNSVLGFTRVFRILREVKKPLLGHNMLLDLMLMYDKFHKPLPATFSEFKTEIMTVFPKIYDTKVLSNNFRTKYRDDCGGLLDKTSLSELYQQLDSTAGQQFVICTPTISHALGYSQYSDQQVPHEAGFDAYMCGYAFLRLAHIATFKDIPSSDVRPCGFSKYLQTLKPFLNHVNLIRGHQSYVNLGGADPLSTRPELLFVQPRQAGYQLNSDRLASWFSPHGSVDIRLESKQRALVATGNHFCSKSILKAFQSHKLISVTKYNMWKHSLVVRRVVIAGTFLSGALVAWAALSGDKQQKV